MELNKINTYFPVDFRGRNKGEACFHIFSETVMTTDQADEIANAIDPVWKKYFPMCLSYEPYQDVLRLFADYQYCEEKYYDEIPENILKALNHISGIRKVIINDGSIITDEEKTETDRYDEFGEADLNEVLGLTKLNLSYTVHAEGIEGECFNYSIYFTDNSADEEKADAVRNAVLSFDFGLTGDDYIGYFDISSGNNKVSIYLDLGNVESQNENNIIHGILLALNSIKGIKKVIINEEYF